MEDKRTSYEKSVQDRSTLRYVLGLLARWKQNFKYEKARRIARKRGATIGQGVIMSIELAKKSNQNLIVGDHTSIQTNNLDLRIPLKIGNNVIIGSGVNIITVSHNIESIDWEHKYYGLEVEDYVWVATNAMITPSCRRISNGAVVGAGSVVVRDVSAMSVVGGNPAKEIKKRKQVHSNLVIESLLGGDFWVYIKTRKKRAE